MGLLNGGLASAFHASLSSLYMDGTLHRKAAYQIDASGAPIEAPDADEAVKVQVDQATFRMSAADGYVHGDQRVLMLAHGLSARPTTDDEVTVEGERFRIMSAERDPAGAYWELRVRSGG